MLVLLRSWYGSCSRPLLRFSQQSVVFHPRTTGNRSGVRQFAFRHSPMDNPNQKWTEFYWTVCMMFFVISSSMAKPSIGKQAENQFYQSALAAKCVIDRYSFTKPRDNRRNQLSPDSFDFLCDVLHPTTGLLTDVKVEIKASGKGTVLLTTEESNLAQRSSYDKDFLVVVYRHTPTSVVNNRFTARKVISPTTFAAGTSRLRVKA